MKLRTGNGFFTIVDDHMHEFLSTIPWNASFSKPNRVVVQTSFPRENGKRQTVLLHHLVVGFPLNGMVVDHINGDTLDNRHGNLRIVTTRQNLQNRKEHRMGRLPGTCWNSKKRRWQAQALINGEHKHLGSFKTEIEAGKAYRNAVG